MAAAARAMPDLAALIFSAYCSGIRGDFLPPACAMAAKSMSSSWRACAAHTLVECPPPDQRSGLAYASSRSAKPTCLETSVANDDIDCMDLRQLRYFVAVAEERHFSRAAIRVGIEQSPLSRAIRALECDVGARLLERSTRGSRLTLAGEIFLQHARTIIAAMDQARNAVWAAVTNPKGATLN
jgi:hypothetical protein